MRKASFQDLVGRKIVKVDDDCVNAIELKTEDGKTFLLDIERMSSSFDLYGIVVWEKEPNDNQLYFCKAEELNENDLLDKDEVPTVRIPSCG